MKAFVLVNMGAPESQSDMKFFLRRMFRDPLILPMNKVARFLLGEIITNFRYKKSWAKYVLIGGSPLKESCQTIAKYLSKNIKENYKIEVAYSYSNPLIETVLSKLISENIDDIVIVPMYPQVSFSTTGSIERDIKKIQKKHPNIQISILPEYYSNKAFVDFWIEQISKTIQKHSLTKPTLLFSAHSVPQYQIDKGDTYGKAIQESAKLISEMMNLPYRVGFQSKIGRMKWLEPATEKVLTDMKNDGLQEIIIVPISFLTENLETLYDIDTLLIPQFNQNGKIHKVQLANTEQELAIVFSLILK